MALLLNQEIKRRHFFRVIAILPWTMPDVIGGLVWKFIFDTLPGFVNGVLIRSKFLAEPIDFLGMPLLAFSCFIFAEVWRGYPFVMIILLAGLLIGAGLGIFLYFGLGIGRRGMADQDITPGRQMIASPSVGSPAPGFRSNQLEWGIGPVERTTR